MADNDSLADIWKLKKRAQRDSDRHKELVKKEIKKNGKDLITEYNIIKSDGNKKIKIPIKFLERYRLKYGDSNPQKGTGQGADVKPGQAYRPKKSEQGSGQPGNEKGEDVYEAEISIDELVEILLEELDLPWMEPTASSLIEVENEEFTSIARKGIFSDLDFKRTLLENIKRNAAKGHAEIKDINESDLKYRVWENENEYHSNAVVYLMMDRSGSMDKPKTDIAKTFYFWMVQFLKKRYKHIELVFIAHDVEAKICSEDDFFKILASGGTQCSSAYKLAYEHLKVNYPTEDWNAYVFEMSDGDNYGVDNEKVLEYVQLLLPLVRAMGYGEIMAEESKDLPFYAPDRLLSTLLENNVNRTRFVCLRFSTKDDIFAALKKFFNIDKKTTK